VCLCACFRDQKCACIPGGVRIHSNVHDRTHISIPNAVIGINAEIISSCAAEINSDCIILG